MNARGKSSDKSLGDCIYVNVSITFPLIKTTFLETLYFPLELGAITDTQCDIKCSDGWVSAKQTIACDINGNLNIEMICNGNVFENLLFHY